MIISHIKKDDGQWVIQSNDAHQQGVSKRCSKFAATFGMEQWGCVLGLLHDLGKESPGFQQYIKKMSGYDSEAVLTESHNHAYVGGIASKMLFPHHFPLLANAIMGHHRGLYDFDEMLEKINAELPAGIVVPNLNVQLSLPKLPFVPQDFHHIQRMLFSCLVDADYLDTEEFMNPSQSQMRGAKSTMGELLVRLEHHLAALKSNSSNTPVNAIRNYVQEQCVKMGDTPCGFYSLTVPTGGGKTLSSLLWALRHAIKNGQQRIIIAIPYTSIITQTSSILKGIFGQNNVLEHHSEFTGESTGDDELMQSLKLATENWDFPIIVTTNVQLFESLFSNQSAQCRKLHNVANSVIILDEVQTLPLTHLQPIVDTLGTLHRIFGVSVLFTTASQPILSGKILGCNPLIKFDALPSITEIIPPEKKLHSQLRRVQLTFDSAQHTYDDVAAEMMKHDRVLCVVNTRRDAKEIYDRLQHDDDALTIHLSRMMYPSHVKRVIKELCAALRFTQKKIRVISTQLIECGVDIDFPVAFRQEAGLDSVLQAAGRCNREGNLEGLGHTWVFSLQASNSLPIGSITQANDARKSLGSNHDWFAPETMVAYFKQLHARTDTFDKPKMGELLYTPRPQFETASSCFRLIDDKTTPVVVACEESKPLIEKLKCVGPSFELMRQLRQYSVNVRAGDLKKLHQSGALTQVSDTIEIFLLHPRCYDEKTGLCVDNQWLDETLII